MFQHLENAMDISELLICNTIINKFTCKYETIDRKLYISIKIPKTYKYEYIAIPENLINMTSTLDHVIIKKKIDRTCDYLNQLFICKLAETHPQYKFIDYNVYEIFSSKIV
jgi:hypothetical protein